MELVELLLLVLVAMLLPNEHRYKRGKAQERGDSR